MRQLDIAKLQFDSAHVTLLHLVNKGTISAHAAWFELLNQKRVLGKALTEDSETTPDELLEFLDFAMERAKVFREIS